MLGRKSSINASTISRIENKVKMQPDITLEELIDGLWLPIKKSRLSVILIGLGLAFKKKRCLQKSGKGKTSKKSAGGGAKR